MSDFPLQDPKISGKKFREILSLTEVCKTFRNSVQFMSKSMTRREEEYDNSKFRHVNVAMTSF